jgi:hypothetical protein
MKRVPLAWVWVPQNLPPGGVEISPQPDAPGQPSPWVRFGNVFGSLLLGGLVGTIAVFHYRTLLNWVWQGLNIPVGLQAVLLLVVMAGILVRFLSGRLGVVVYAAAYLATMYFFDYFSSDSKLLVSLSTVDTTWVFNYANYIVVIAGTLLAALPLLPPNSWFILRSKTPKMFE